jgi:hypothetical protein
VQVGEIYFRALVMQNQMDSLMVIVSCNVTLAPRVWELLCSATGQALIVTLSGLQRNIVEQIVMFGWRLHKKSANSIL